MDAKQIKNQLSSQLSNQLGDTLTNLEMDVTNSFLNGKVCSPLLAAASNTMSYVNGTISIIQNTAGKAGLYITKNNLNFDPTVMTDAAGQIVTSAINLAAGEIIRLKDNALREITYIPDPSIIMKKALSYFAYDIQYNIDFNNILDTVKIDDKLEKQDDVQLENTKKGLQKFIDESLPTIMEKVSGISDKINNVSTTVSSYMSFGPDWVMDNISDVVGEGSYIAEQYLNEQTNKINDWKMQQYDKCAKMLGDKMTQQYESIIKKNAKDINDEIEVQKQKIKNKAETLLQKANLTIMAKTGIKIPIEKISKQNISKVKRSAKLASLLQLASQSTPSNGPDNSNEKPTNKEETTTASTVEQTDPRYEKYSEEYIDKLISGLNQLNMYAKNEAWKYAKLMDQYDYDTPEYEQAWDNRTKYDDIEYDTGYYGDQLTVYKRMDTDKFFNDPIRRKNGFNFNNIDTFISTINNLLEENTIVDSNGKIFVWDKTEGIFVSNIMLDDTSSEQGSSSTPEMYVQTFLNSGDVSI